LPHSWRHFLYLPFMHSEDADDQELCVALYKKLGIPRATYFARLHQSVIERFGRFPHRNDALGRDSTEEERRFLADRGRGF